MGNPFILIHGGRTLIAEDKIPPKDGNEQRSEPTNDNEDYSLDYFHACTHIYLTAHYIDGSLRVTLLPKPYLSQNLTPVLF